MHIHVDLHVHNCDPATEQKLDRILSMLATVIQKENIMAGELDQLTKDVAAESTVDDSVIALLTGIKAQLDAAIASGNPAALTALSTSLQASQAKMAAAIVANTPAAA